MTIGSLKEVSIRLLVSSTDRFWLGMTPFGPYNGGNQLVFTQMNGDLESSKEIMAP